MISGWFVVTVIFRWLFFSTFIRLKRFIYLKSSSINKFLNNCIVLCLKLRHSTTEMSWKRLTKILLLMRKQYLQTENFNLLWFNYDRLRFIQFVDFIRIIFIVYFHVGQKALRQNIPRCRFRVTTTFIILRSLRSFFSFDIYICCYVNKFDWNNLQS